MKNKKEPALGCCDGEDQHWLPLDGNHRENGFVSAFVEPNKHPRRRQGRTEKSDSHFQKCRQDGKNVKGAQKNGGGGNLHRPSTKAGNCSQNLVGHFEGGKTGHPKGPPPQAPLPVE